MRLAAVLSLALVAALAVGMAESIQFDLGPTNTYFCLGAEFYNGQNFKGAYAVPDLDDHWDTTITVHSPSRQVVWSRPNVDNQPGEFQMQAVEDGVYKVCFASAVANNQVLQTRFRQRGNRGRQGGMDMQRPPTPNTRRVDFSIEEVTDINPEYARRQQEFERQARAASKIAKTDVISQTDLQPINLVLIRTETQIERLKNEFREFRQREVDHRNTNESTNTRTVSFSMLTIIALCILALWQGYYMRNYFKKKKLI